MRCPPQWGCEEPSSHFQKYWLIQYVLAIDSGSIGLVHSHFVLPSTSNVWRGRGEAIWSCTKVSNSQKGCSVDWPRLSLNTLCVYHLKGGPIGGQLLRQWCRSSACLIQPSLALNLRLSPISTMVTIVWKHKSNNWKWIVYEWVRRSRKLCSNQLNSRSFFLLCTFVFSSGPLCLTDQTSTIV